MKYLLLEKNHQSNSESWVKDLTMDQAVTLGEKSSCQIVKIFTDDKDVKLVKVIKDEQPSYLNRFRSTIK